MKRTMMASQHRWIYVSTIVLLIALLVTALLTFSQQKTTNEAARKAGQLSEKLVAAGYPAPDQGQIARTLGTDGGPVCEDPASALKTALQRINMSNGAGGPGQRPVISNTRTVQAEALALSVYCPDQLDDFERKVDDYKTAKTVENP
ncbi:hypothetical protein KCMC57_up13940 [Kitasatospora sp. CMC57]|uniref:DUF732 domain-containing protein n=1 Tax=Kitasatospora sp. CMC57 TaxID=3231513 RepID=A0AB33JQS2_9ACTN